MGAIAVAPGFRGGLEFFVGVRLDVGFRLAFVGRNRFWLAVVGP